MTRSRRKELSDLSEEVFGRRSKWQKILKNGQVSNLTAYSVGRQGKMEKTSKTVWHTVQSVEKYMLDLREEKQKLMEEMKTSAKGS